MASQIISKSNRIQLLEKILKSMIKIKFWEWDICDTTPLVGMDTYEIPPYLPPSTVWCSCKNLNLKASAAIVFHPDLKNAIAKTTHSE